ncbi:hypothetical protein [Palleronia sp. LCG004]|uniref:hypothetical protein n=1 Tax=Palleronia sp. LCG004 TaxID=3079304 RepID=UPI002942A6B6|nr:hypothetical protein [Palleronia sp. LCG004]WOI55274.1 hypothetical protein RVY76_09450 [Palleronia sp. LCG004]
MKYPETPDGRYFVAKGRLWRKTDPGITKSAREEAVSRLMAARRAVGQANDDDERVRARAKVDAAKRDLGERGPVWWSDGKPDETRKAPWNSSYAEWWETLDEATREAGIG